MHFKMPSNGSDFYFYGINQEFLEHSNMEAISEALPPPSTLDVGTSRFDERGRIYQAVCAGCGGNDDLPTTPGAFSETNNSSNCNLGVIKLDFETGLEAKAEIDLNYLIDTNCYELTLKLDNNSVNANAYFWDFDQGDTSNLKTQSLPFPTLHTTRLWPLDTLYVISTTLPS